MTKRWLIALMVVVECLVAIPVFLNGALAEPGTMPKFLHYYEDDGVIYSNYLYQIIYEKRWLLEDRFTGEEGVGVFNLLWLVVGLLGRIFQLPPWGAHQLARMIIAPLLVYAVYLCVKRLFPDRPVPATAAVLMVSGIGWLQMVSGKAGLFGVMDMFVQESTFANVFMSSAHIIASYAALIGGMYAFFLWRDTGSGIWLAYACALSAVLMQFHPYHLLTIVLLTAAWLVLTFREWKRDVLGYSVWLLSLALPMSYHLWLQRDLVQSARYAGNVTLSPSLMTNLVTLSLLIVLAGIGYWRHRSLPFARFLGLWVLVSGYLVHAPLPTNRRFVEGLFLPLGILALLGVAEGAKWIERQPKLRHMTVAFACAAAFWLFTGSVQTLVVFAHGQSTAVLGADETRVVLDLRKAPPGIVLAPMELGYHILAESSQRLYVMTLGETVDFSAKFGRAERWLAAPTEADPDELRDAGITYAVIASDSQCFSGFSERARYESYAVCERR